MCFLFLSVPGVTGIDDDMIIYGKTNHEHDQNLLNFLEVCRKNNLTHFGHTWSYKGLSADPKKDRSCEKNGTSTGCGNHEKFPQIGQLPQPIQPTSS